MVPFIIITIQVGIYLNTNRWLHILFSYVFLEWIWIFFFFYRKQLKFLVGFRLVLFLDPMIFKSLPSLL